MTGISRGPYCNSTCDSQAYLCPRHNYRIYVLSRRHQREIWSIEQYPTGAPTGEIWGASAGGSDVLVTPPAVEDRIPDQFGRRLAFSGDRLLVGAPHAAAPVTMSGRTEIWRHQDGGWEREGESVAPAPDFSGWHGRDVALYGELAAVVEAGQDISGKDRGANAKVHRGSSGTAPGPLTRLWRCPLRRASPFITTCWSSAPPTPPPISRAGGRASSRIRSHATQRVVSPSWPSPS